MNNNNENSVEPPVAHAVCALSRLFGSTLSFAHISFPHVLSPHKPAVPSLCRRAGLEARFPFDHGGLVP